jgi:tetratricopeptide (TPR) repeat protein
LASFTPAVLEFVAGNGEVCDALECAVAEMKKGEQAVITAVAADAKEARLGLQGVQDGQVVLTVELQNFDKGKEMWDMSEEEKLEYGSARKEVGSALLKAGRLNMALQRYKKVSDMFSYVDNFKEENKEKAKALKLACESNKAVVYLKLTRWSEALSTCNTVLTDDKSNIKAYYRRAQAHLNLKNFLDCIADCKKVVELDPSNKEARTLLKQAQAGQKEEDKKAKGLFANMCKALGKGPIPEPCKADKIGDYSDEELEAKVE